MPYSAFQIDCAREKISEKDLSGVIEKFFSGPIKPEIVLYHGALIFQINYPEKNSGEVEKALDYLKELRPTLRRQP